MSNDQTTDAGPNEGAENMPPPQPDLPDIGATRAATFHFLNPFFGVAIAALLLGENLGSLDIAGVAIIAGGILAVQLSKQHKVEA